MRLSKLTFIRGLAAAAILLLTAACEGVGPDQDLIDNPPTTDEEQTQPTLNVRTDNIDFAEEDEPVRVLVFSNRDWTFEPQQEWIHGRKSDEHTLMISVDESSEPSTRTGSMVVRASESVAHTIEIRQLGWGKDILLSSTLLTAEADGDTVEVGVTTNFDIRVDIGCDWIKSNAGTRAHPQSTRKYTFAVEPNFNDSSRSGDITFSDAAGEGSDFMPQQLTVQQKGLSDYSPGNAGSGDLEIKDPVKVKVTGAEADLKGVDGHSIEKSYDGNASTYYMTDYTPGAFPYSLTYYFDGEQIDYIRYTVAASGSQDGNLERVEISAQTADGWTEVMTHNFNYKSGTVEMPMLLSGVTAIRISVLNANNWKISVGEMEFLKQNPDNFDWRTMFTDRSCSELLDSVTDEDIAACGHLLYRNLARWMKDGTYDTEFRAAEYRAFDDPMIQANLERGNAYSRLDNVTGIVVKKDEELVVLAELNGRSDVRLAVDEFDRSAYGDNGISYRDEFPLVSGANKIKITRPGILYIMYNVADWKTAPPVRIHFASGGKVNGYYDTQKHGPDRWRELLSKANNYRIFDVVGRFSHMVYEVGHFRTYTKDVYDLAEIYDEIVYREQVFCGLMRNRGADEFRHNRVLVNICYDANTNANMYTSHYYISVPSRMGQYVYAMQNENLRSERASVLAHEVGHIHANSFTKFAGTMSEVTNNNLQMYIVREMYGGTSPIKSHDGYSIGWNKVIVPKASHHAVVYGYSHEALAPLWQLELYFGCVLGRTPKRLGSFAEDMAAFERADQMSDEEYAEYFDGFYPTLYDRMRNFVRNNSAKTNAQYMMQFAVEASHAAKMDLTDFFTKWGFFTGETGCVVNEADREAALKAIADAGYQPVTDAIEYITDDNWKRFKEKAQVVAGTATASKNGLTFSGCKNAVAYELYDGDTMTRILESSTDKYTDIQWKDSYRLYAVQYDGQRIEIDVVVK